MFSRAVRRKMKTSQVTKVHEAGHALARVLNSDIYGIDPSEAISSIEFDMYQDIATTYGPWGSKKMHEKIGQGTPGTSISPERLRDVCSDLDLIGWLEAKIFENVMGPAAEAKFTNVSIVEIWRSEECAGDVLDVARNCYIAKIEDEDAINELVDAALERAVLMVEQEWAWSAIIRLANSLPDRAGTFPGKRAVAILNIT